jgi:hypothetical protein
MSHEIELQLMTVDDLAQRCAQETDFYFNHKNYDSKYCFELFRRAIRNRDGQAWGLVMLQYQPLVTRWVDRWMSKHPDFSQFNEETQDFVAQAFERLWVSFTPAKLEKSQNLAANCIAFRSSRKPGTKSRKFRNRTQHRKTAFKTMNSGSSSGKKRKSRKSI